MKIEIDQSWKIEKTNKPTVIAYSNKSSNAIIISSKDKKVVQKYFRELNKPRLFCYLTFTALIFLLVKNHLLNGDQIYVDQEYPGFDKLIILKISQFIQENSRLKDIDIHISTIGKKSRAHLLAIKTFNSKNKNQAQRIYAHQVIKIINKNLTLTKKSGNA